MGNNIKTKRNRIEIFDYMKAFAIIAVVITHCKFSLIQKTHISFTFVIGMAVPIFMLITGYNYAKSYQLRSCKSFIELYNIKLLLKRFIRIVLPFLIIFLLEFFLLEGKINSDNFLHFFIRGGIGPGSYYFPVIMQIIFLYPFIYKILYKYKEKGLLALIFIEFLSIFICTKTNFNLKTYRLLAFRYLSLVSFGTYLSLYPPKFSPKKVQLMFLLGLSMMIIMIYGNNPIACYPYTRAYWGFRSGLPVTLYIFPIVTKQFC